MTDRDYEGTHLIGLVNHHFPLDYHLHQSRESVEPIYSLQLPLYQQSKAYVVDDMPDIVE